MASETSVAAAGTGEGGVVETGARENSPAKKPFK
jgi:hypothetical protein